MTGEFLNPDGEVDLFAHAEVDPRAARRTLRTGATDLTTVAASDELVQTLAGLDQTQLWSAAARVRVTDEQLQAEAEATGSAPEDADMIDRIEHSHHMLEATVERQDRLRRKAFLTAGLCAVVGIPSAVLVPSLAIPIIAVGLLVTVAAFGYRARVNRAFDAEREALGEAGAQSYLGFQLQRVNGLVSSQENRRRLLAAAEDHRVAAARWSEIVGDVSVDWALEHHEAITAAARLRDDIHSIGQLSSGSVEVGTDQAAALAQALVARLVQARNLGTHQESFPVILDDPFVGLAAAREARVARAAAPHRRHPAGHPPHRRRGRRLLGPARSPRRRAHRPRALPARLPRRTGVVLDGVLRAGFELVSLELGRSFLATRSGFADPALTGRGCSAWRTAQLHHRRT